MPDAQSSSSLEPAPADAPQGISQAARSIVRYLGLAVLLAAAVVWAVPDMRTQVFHYRSQLVDTSIPAAENEVADAALQAPVVGVDNHVQAAAFLDSMGDGEPIRKLPAVKVSATQAESLSRYIARKYKVSNEATHMLISTAYGVGQEMEIDPLLLLAIIAIESSFNPFAESNVGAQGLMQVLTKVHSEKFQPFGGDQAAWNPVANIHVGASILKDYISRGGSLMAGLRMYVGVAADGSSPYGERVLAERRRLASVVGAPADLSAAGKSPARPAAPPPAITPLPAAPVVPPNSALHTASASSSVM